MVWYVVFALLAWAVWRAMRKGAAGRDVVPPARPERAQGYRVPPQPAARPRRSTVALRWMGNNEPLRLAGYTVANPMLYASDGPPAEPEASCIDTSLKIGIPVSEPKGALGYYPEYARLTPDQRATYLAWLAAGRRGPLTDIGYAFLFFYGLERRVLVEGSDALPVLDEVMGLLQTYRESRSFDQYLGNFITCTLCGAGLHRVEEAALHRLLLRGLPVQTDASLRVLLAWHARHDKGLPAEVAYEVARQDARSTRSVVTTRLPGEHRELFVRRYAAQFDGGLKLSESKRTCDIRYFPASPSLARSARHAWPAQEISDVLAKSAQFKPLAQLWNSCVEELRGASRQLAKGQDLQSRAAYEALPPTLRAQQDHPDKVNWELLVAAHLRDSGYVKLPVSALASLREIAPAGRLTRKQSVELAEASAMLGYALVPDPWTLQRPYVWDEQVALVPSGDESGTADENRYRAAALLLEIGIGMAAADGAIDRDEVVFLSNSIRGQFRLSGAHARRLEAYRSLLLKDPPSLTGLGKRIGGFLDGGQRTTLAKYLAGVAAVDGRVDTKERAALRKVCRAMGIAGGDADALVEGLLALPASDAPVPVRAGTPARGGEALPPARELESPGLVLDMALIESIARETASVAEMIGLAMGELDPAEREEAPPAVAVPIPESPTPQGATTWSLPRGLGARYQEALHALLDRPEWSKPELRAVAERHGLMPNALIDEINTWAEEHLGDYLINGENPYEINHALLEAA